MLLSFILLPCCLHLSLVTVSSAAKLDIVYAWRYIDYTWESDAARAAAIESGDYNSTKPIMIDVDVWKNRKVFATVLRRDGVPASLTTVSSKSGDGGPLLQPYPDWSWTKKNDCNGITNVYRVAIDECDRLWVLDSGQIDDKQICSAQLLAFDLNTDRLMIRVKIPDSVYRNPATKAGLLVTPVVETAGRYCQRTHIYIADVTGHALLVWNGRALWRLPSPVFSPQQWASNVTIAGESFELPDGVLGMALSPRGTGQARFLAFRPFASFDINFVETLHLQQAEYGESLKYTVASGILPSQAVAMAFSSQRILFFGLTSETALACWDTEKPNRRENIVMLEQNPKTLQFASGLKVIPSRITGYSEEIWMVTNRFQKIAKDTQNFDEVNFRIIAGQVHNLIAGTNCDPTPIFPLYNYWYYHRPVGVPMYVYGQRYW